MEIRWISARRLHSLQNQAQPVVHGAEVRSTYSTNAALLAFTLFLGDLVEVFQIGPNHGLSDHTGFVKFGRGSVSELADFLSAMSALAKWCLVREIT